MSIKAVLLDVSRTLIQHGQVVAGVPEMLAHLHHLGLTVLTASNNDREARLAQQILGLSSDATLSSKQFGNKRKGTKSFVNYVCHHLGITPNELVYLGDADNDMREAVNADVLFFLATWANSAYPYGIRVRSPMRFAEILETFFLKTARWYYRLDSHDTAGRPVTIRALLDPDTAKDTGITELLKSKGKRGSRQIGLFHNTEYISLHLLASIYLEGLHLQSRGRQPLWCVYPGSGGAYDSILDEFISKASQLFRDKYVHGLIQRSQSVLRCSTERKRGGNPSIDRQLQSIYLNPEFQHRIQENHIIVLDDFTTYAHAFETSRNFLLHAGAASVTCIAVGKYPPRGEPRSTYHAHVPRDDVLWSSFAPNPALHEAQFTLTRLHGDIDDTALAFF